jgi:hypothetical protein
MAVTFILYRHFLIHGLITRTYMQMQTGNQ